MLQRSLGNSGIQASVIALGSWSYGGWMWGGTDDENAIRAIHVSLDNGVNFIDTAAIYGYGRSEEIVGRAIRGRRDKVVLATKCGLRWDVEKGDFHFHGNEKGATRDPSKYKIYKYLHPDSIFEEIERSLKRLGTDYIDLYQTHWQDSTTAIADTMSALEKLREQGKIRAIGVSNANIEQIKEYGGIDSDQERFSMLDRKIADNGQLEYCREHNIAVLAYSPLVHGLLTGKMSPEREFNEGDLRKNNPRFSPDNIRRANAMLQRFGPLAEKYGVLPHQLVIAWTFHQPGLTHVLCGARTEQQALENARAGSIRLCPEDIQTINDIVRQSEVQ